MKKKFIILMIIFPVIVYCQQICNDYYACNYAFEEDCSYPLEYYDCNNTCINDIDGDGVCDELELLGCTDDTILDGNPMACNFNPFATDDDGSCIYPGLVFDCDGVTCLNDMDGDGVCNENEVFGCDDINAYNFNSSVTENDGSCWFPVYGCSEPNAGNYNPYTEIDDDSCIFSPWQYYSTDCNMTILIPADANLNIDNTNLEYGDWIGAFFYDQNQNLNCGGAVMWKEETTSIALWGAESDLDNGFQSNEEIVWKVFKNDSENILIPEFNFGSNFYQCNSLGGIQELSIYNQEIFFPPGWTIFSSYIVPIDNHVEKIFENIDDLIIMKDQNGDVFWPALGINQIENINYNQGYIVKMNYESVGNSIIFSGQQVPSDTELILSDGWNIISYLNRSPAPVDEMMQLLAENLIIIKDEDGLIYWPEFGVNSMNNMFPGRGYQIKLNSNSLFSYPNIEIFRLSFSNESLVNTYYGKVNKTGENMTIGIPISSWETIPSIGDEIAVYSSDHLLVGSQIFDGNSIAISIWGNDLSNDEKDGMNSGEKFYFKLWDKNLNQEEKLNVDFWSEGGGNYKNNLLSVVGSISKIEQNLEDEVIIGLYNISGKRVESLKNNEIGIIVYKNGYVKKNINFSF
tara:strand:+ start:207 stop:2096 length:1890 start_codon:yes stop_codon:yes gene_type:complete